MPKNQLNFEIDPNHLNQLKSLLYTQIKLFSYTPKLVVGWRYKMYKYKPTLNDNSRFSPPHMSIPASYVPSWVKYSRLMENNPPAIVGDL